MKWEIEGEAQQRKENVRTSAMVSNNLQHPSPIWYPPDVMGYTSCLPQPTSEGEEFGEG